MNLFFKIKCVLLMVVIILLSHGRIQYHSSIHAEWKKSNSNVDHKVGKLSSGDKEDLNLIRKRHKVKGTKVLMAHVPDSNTPLFFTFSETVVSNTGKSFLRSIQKSHPKRGPPAV